MKKEDDDENWQDSRHQKHNQNSLASEAVVFARICELEQETED